MYWKSFVDSLSGGIPHSDPRFRGLKTSLIGFLITLCGLGLFLGQIQTAGKLVILFGMLIVFSGAVLHIAAMLRSKSKKGKQKEGAGKTE